MLFKPAETNNHNSFLQEKVILKTRPHWIIPAFWLFLVLLWLAVFNLALVVGGFAGIRVYLLFVAVLFSSITASFIFLDWLSSIFFLTDKQVIHRRGLVWKNCKVIPVKRIQNLSYHQGVLGRIFDFGNLTVESAGTSFGVMILYGIPSPRKLAIKIYEQIQTSKNNGF